MNTNMIINISIIVGAIAITIINENLKKQNQQRMYDSIKNKLNSSNASIREIKLAYKYETGKSPFYTNKKDGTSLEYRVFKMLYKYKGKVLSSLHTNNNGKTNESDAVFVHNTGIYVIECKDTNAINVIGDEYSKDWDYIFSNKYIEKRYNPLKQNLGHINSLKKVLNNKYSNECYISVIVINSKGIKVNYTSNYTNYYQNIVTPDKLKLHIELLINKRDRIFSDEEVMDIYKYLHENYANASSQIRKSHIINVQNEFR